MGGSGTKKILMSSQACFDRLSVVEAFVPFAQGDK